MANDIKKAIELVTSNILFQLTDFQHECIKSARSLEAEIYDGLAAIDDIQEKIRLAKANAEIAMTKDGRSLPAPDRAMDWEVDTNSGDNVPDDPALDLVMSPMFPMHTHRPC